MPSTICSVNAIQISSSWTSSWLRCSVSIAAARASAYRSGSSTSPCRSPTRRYPSGPSSGPGRKSVKSTSNKTAFSTLSRIDPTLSRRDGRRPEVGFADREAKRGLSPAAPRKGGTWGETSVSPHDSVGVPRFELGASPTRTERATRLRHTPGADRVPARRRRSPTSKPGVAQRRRAAVCSGRDRSSREAARLTRPGSQ